MLSLFCQISPKIRLKHSTGIAPHAFVCPPSLPVWLRSAVCFCLIKIKQNLEIGHSMYCTTQADIIMTEELTAVIQRKHTHPILSLFLDFVNRWKIWAAYSLPLLNVLPISISVALIVKCFRSSVKLSGVLMRWAEFKVEFGGIDRSERLSGILCLSAKDKRDI